MLMYRTSQGWLYCLNHSSEASSWFRTSHFNLQQPVLLTHLICMWVCIVKQGYTMADEGKIATGSTRFTRLSHLWFGIANRDEGTYPESEKWSQLKFIWYFRHQPKIYSDNAIEPLTTLSHWKHSRRNYRKMAKKTMSCLNAQLNSGTLAPKQNHPNARLTH